MKAETESRIFSVDEYVRPSNGEPIRSVVLETNDSVVVVWHAYPRQEIAAHVHPHGQDTWTVISGEAKYYQGNGVEIHLKAGDIAIADFNNSLPDAHNREHLVNSIKFINLQIVNSC